MIMLAARLSGHHHTAVTGYDGAESRGHTPLGLFMISHSTRQCCHRHNRHNLIIITILIVIIIIIVIWHCLSLRGYPGYWILDSPVFIIILAAHHPRPNSQSSLTIILVENPNYLAPTKTHI